MIVCEKFIDADDTLRTIVENITSSEGYTHGKVKIVNGLIEFSGYLNTEHGVFEVKYINNMITGFVYHSGSKYNGENVEYTGDNHMWPCCGISATKEELIFYKTISSRYNYISDIFRLNSRHRKFTYEKLISRDSDIRNMGNVSEVNKADVMSGTSVFDELRASINNLPDNTPCQLLETAPNIVREYVLGSQKGLCHSYDKTACENFIGDCMRELDGMEKIK